MEKRKTFRGEENINRILDAQNKSVEQQRFLFYSDKIPTRFLMENLLETDDKIYYSESTCTTRFVKKIFYTRKTNKGFTIDKTTNKLNIWFGGRISSLSSDALKIIIDYYKLDWLASGRTQDLKSQTSLKKFKMNNSVDVLFTLEFMFNKTVFNKIAKGKVTNLRSLIKAYLDSNPNLRNQGISPEVIYQLLQRNTDANLYLLLADSVDFEDPNHYMLNRNPFQNIYDMKHQAKILGKKINSRWSEKRAAEVHAKWTQEIMLLELDLVEDINFDYIGLNKLPLIPGLKLITTNKELFTEGMTQHHCVYTNYKTSVRNCDFFVFIYEGKERSTLGISRITLSDQSTKMQFGINQMYKAYNKEVCHEDRNTILQWLASDEVQEFFIKNYTRKNNESLKINPNMNNNAFMQHDNLNAFL